VSLDKILVFSKPLKAVTLGETGPAPIGGAALEKERADYFQKGYQSASDKFNAQLLTMRQEMQEHAQGVLNKIEQNYAALSSEISGQLPELISAGVYQIINELAVDPKVLKARIEKLVADSCPATEPVEVQLHAEDLATLKNIDPEFVVRHTRLSFKANETLERGDCVMRTKFGEVDARIKTQIQRLMEELLGV